MSLYQILDSDLSYDIKIKQICDKLPQNLLVSWACDVAESVLHIYENKYPGDTRPREAIAAARSGDKNRAYAAAYIVDNAVYVRRYAVISAYPDNKAANSAAYAAAYAANSAACGANVAKAAKAAANAVDSNEKQKQVNLQLLRKQVEIFESPLYKLLRED